MSSTSTIGIRLALEGADKTETGIRRVAGSLGSLDDAATSVRSAFAGMAGTLAGSLSIAGLTALVNETTRAADQIQRLSTLANASNEEFQKMSFGAERFGISQEKLADILKDVQDKVGDFTQTGGGGMADFFENIAPKVGVTADQFRRLGGADALQLYVSSLEKANLSQSEMVFYLEAVASDSALLLPLLRDNGKEMQRLGEEAQRAGVVMNDSTVAAARQLKQDMDSLSSSLQGFSRQVIAEVLPTLKQVAKEMTDTTSSTSSLAGVLGSGITTALQTVSVLGLNVAFVLKQVGNEIGGIAAQAAAVARLDFSGAREIGRLMREDAARARADVDAASARILNPTQAAAPVSPNAPVSSALGRPPAGADPKPPKPKAGGSSRAADVGENQRALASYVSSLQKTIDKENELTEVQKAQAFLRSIGVVGQVDQVRELVLALAEQRDAQVALEQSTARQAELARIAAEAESARVDALERSAQGVQDQVQKLRDEEQALQIAAAGNITLAQAIEQVSIARLQEEQASLMKAGDRDAEVLAIQKEIDARRELAAAIGRQDVREVAKKQAEDAQKEWQKTADSIGDALTNALMRGFEDGKSFGENFSDSLVNAFKTYVARELQKALTNAITGAFSNGGQGFNLGSIFGGGGQGGFNWGDMASKAWSYFTGGSTSAAASGAIANGMTQAQMIAVQDAAVGVTTNVATGAVTAATTTGTTTAAASGASAAGAGAMGAVPVVGWIAAAVMAADALYKKGYNRDALKGVGESRDYKYSAENAARGLLDGLGFSKKWADILSGTVRMATLFGRRLKQEGYEVDISGQKVDVEQYAYYKGGLFRSNKTVRAAADDSTVESLRFQVENVRDSSKAMAQALGYSGEALDNFTGRMRVNLKGADDSAEAAKRYEEALLELQREMINTATGLNYTKEEFKRFTEDVTASMTEAGISAGGIADIITQGMLGKMSNAQVGEALSDMVIGGIYNAIASSYAGQIASVFTGQIIQPIFTALAAGVPIANAIQQSAIDNVVAKAKEAAAQLNAIFADQSFRAAIAGVQEAISGISGAATSVNTPAYKVKAATTNYNAAADAAKRAAEETRRAWQSIADSITEEIRRIRGELLGDTSAGQSFYQSQFDDATRRARMGDQEAAKMLPELSQAVLDIARATAGSLAELQFVQTSTLASLTQTRKILRQQYGVTIPAFADGGLHSGGLRLVGERGPELEVTGPARYFDARRTQQMLGGDPAMAAKLDELIKASQRQADGISQIETNTRRTQQILTTVSQGGDSFVTVSA